MTANLVGLVFKKSARYLMISLNRFSIWLLDYDSFCRENTFLYDIIDFLLLGKVPAIISNFVLYASYYVYLKLNQRTVKRPKVDSSIVVGENGRRRRRNLFVYQR